jgi:hypothetical protein
MVEAIAREMRGFRAKRASSSLRSTRWGALLGACSS